MERKIKLIIKGKINYELANYRKSPIIIPGLICVQKGFLVGLFLAELISEGLVYYCKEFYVSKWFGLGNKK